MRLLILNWKDLNHPQAGGAERYVSALAHAWNAAGHNVTILTPKLHGHPAEDEIGGIKYLRQGTRLTTFNYARRYLRKAGARYDHVLESVSTRPYFAHRIVGPRATALYLQIADDVWSHEFPPPVAWAGRYVVEPAWLRRMRGARVVSISPSTAVDLARFGVDVVGTVPPGCDIPATPPAPRQLSDPPRVVFIGRLVRTKRPDHALAAFRLIAAAFPGATLDVVGEGYFAEGLTRDAGDGVVLRGGITDTDKSTLLSAADLVLIPGTREGWGIVAIEAAAHGVPVVAYDIPGLRDSVVHGATGMLTEPFPAAMAAAAIKLLRDPIGWSAMRRAARARATQFTWTAAAMSLLAIVSEGTQVSPEQVVA